VLQGLDRDRVVDKQVEQNRQTCGDDPTTKGSRHATLAMHKNMISLILIIMNDAQALMSPHASLFPSTHVSWPSQEPVKTDVCESKPVSVHVEAVIAPPSPIIVYQTPGADGLEAEPQLGASLSIAAPSEVDPGATQMRPPLE
jgi:hypothetical protein